MKESAYSRVFSSGEPMEKVLAVKNFLVARPKEPGELSAFIEAHRPAILRLTLAILGRSETAEDATQDAMIRATQHWSELQRMDRPDQWLRVVAARRAMTLLGQRPCGGGVPDVAVDADQTEALAVHQTLARLDAATRTLLALAVGEGWSYDEIAAALEIPAGTVASRLNTAKKAFRKAWGEER